MIQKKYFAIVGLALTVALTSACVGNQTPESGSTSFVSSTGNVSSGTSAVSSADHSWSSSVNSLGIDANSSAVSEPVTSAPKSEPTIFIGMDGKPVYVHEITELRNDNYEPMPLSELTEDSEYASAVCTGFAYLKPSTGVTFNMLDNPDLFGTGYEFKGEYPKNTNEWKRVNVGETICGLTLTKAETCFSIPDKRHAYSFPEKYYDGATSRYEFEGELTMTGYFYVDKRDPVYDPDGGMLFFGFGDKSLPLKAMSANVDESGFDANYNVSAIYGTDIIGASECTFIQFDKTIHDTEVDMTGVDIGDLVKAKVTISHLVLSSNTVSAHLEDIEVLSEPVVHPAFRNTSD